MTDLVPQVSRRAARGGRQPGIIPAAAFLALALAAAPAAAQAPQSSPPPQPAVVPAPAVKPPPTAPAAPRGLPAATVAPAARTATAAPPPRVPVRPGPPPDSSRLAAAVDSAPANWVARCRDGAFIVPPATASACSTHRGVLVTIVRPAPPPVPTRATSAPTAAVLAPAAPPPAGSTMRCKDGTYLGGTPFAAACAGHGGLAAILPGARQAPSAAAGPRRP